MGQYFTNENLPSNVKSTFCVVKGHKFTFLTDNGVFSKDGLDFGSRLLLESIPLDEVGAKVLDMGCGYGTIGIIINKLTNHDIDMVDVNLRAMHLAKRNAKENGCSNRNAKENGCSNRNAKENGCSNINIFESNCYQNITSKYNTIITNPPIRAGKKIVYEILMSAKKYLEQDGNLFLVIRKEQGAKSIISDLEKEYNVEILEKKKGFFVLKCTI